MAFAHQHDVRHAMRDVRHAIRDARYAMRDIQVVFTRVHLCIILSLLFVEC